MNFIGYFSKLRLFFKRKLENHNQGFLKKSISMEYYNYPFLNSRDDAVLAIGDEEGYLARFNMRLTNFESPGLGLDAIKTGSFDLSFDIGLDTSGYGRPGGL
ncbi:MAG: hypothetical protein ACUVQV_05045 [Dissulfurimicrobium sp.]|uniref:hypothetical protein n=1 Tax=Dissulfurimicrobium sp. TaxID=2022436 RepID=UPI0040498935